MPMHKYRIKYEPLEREIEAENEDKALEYYEIEEEERWDWPYEIEDLGEVAED